MVPHPITLDDDVVIGTPVTTLLATDSDGTAPGNKVRSSRMNISIQKFNFFLNSNRYVTK